MSGVLTNNEFFAEQNIPTVDPRDFNRSFSTMVPDQKPAPEPVDPAIEAAAPDFSTQLRAAFEESNVVASWAADETRGLDKTMDPNFNLYERARADGNIDAFPALLDEGAFNEKMYLAGMANYNRVKENDKILEAGGWASVGLQIGASVLDVTTLLPGAALVRGTKLGYSVGQSALRVGASAVAGAGVAEKALYATQVDREKNKWLYAVTGAAALGGFGGGVAAKILSKTELTKLGEQFTTEMVEAGVVDAEKTANKVIQTLSDNNLNAAQVTSTIEELNIAGVPARISARMMAALKIDPTAQVLTSQSVEARKVMHGLIETSLQTEENRAGRATGDFVGGGTVESEIRELRGLTSVAHMQAETHFSELIKSGTENLTRDQFFERVGKAMRRGDLDPEGNPYVSEAAGKFRLVADEVKRRGVEIGEWSDDMYIDAKTGLITKDPAKGMDPTTGRLSTYLHRVYNQTELITKGREFQKIVRDWLDTVTPAEMIPDVDGGMIPNPAYVDKFSSPEEMLQRDTYIEGLADNIFDRLTGRFTGSDEFQPWQIPTTRGPLKNRVLSIPDHMIEQFLESDARTVMMRYTRQAAGELGLKRRFGSATLKDQIQKINDEYKALENKIPSGDTKAMVKLRKERDLIIKNIEAFRDMNRGTYGRSAQQGASGALTRSALVLNYMSSLGQVAVSSLPDMAALVGKYGAIAVVADLLPSLATNLRGIRATVREAQLAGTVLERMNNTRLASLAEIQEYNVAISGAEKTLNAASAVFTKATLLPHWNDMMKTGSSVLAQNRLIDVALTFDKASKIDKGWFTQLGLTDGDARTIKELIDSGVIKKKGRLWETNTEKWVDETRAGGAQVQADGDAARKKITDAFEAVKAEPRNTRLQKKTGRLSNAAVQRLAVAERRMNRELAEVDKASRRALSNRMRTQREMVRRFRWALGGDVDRTIVTPGFGDKPLLGHTNGGKLVLQFKSFMLSANRRLLQSGLQGRKLWLAQHIVLGTVLGMGVSYLKILAREGQQEANKLVENPGKWTASGFDRSGTMPLYMELSNVAGKLFNYNPVIDGLSSLADDPKTMKTDASRAAARNVAGTLLGPTAGVAEDVVAITDGIFKAITDREALRKRHVNALLRQIPGSNLLPLDIATAAVTTAVTGETSTSARQLARENLYDIIGVDP